MELYKFQSQVGSKDSYAIRARQLDDNFSRLCPQTNGTYGINETANGWSLNIFPPFPLAASQALFLSYSKGGLNWTPVGAISGTSTNQPNSISPSAISAGANGALFITEDATAKWSLPPSSGTPAWRQVKRCDGKRMWVWGTEWAL